MVVTEPPGSTGNDLCGDTRTDEELLAAHANGTDREAFGELFRRHRDRLWAVAVRTLGDPDDAADAVQDAMLRAYHAAGGFRGEAAVTTWLHRVVVNACLDRLRRRQARPSVPLDLVEERISDEVSETDPIEAGETRITLLSALETLPEQQRAALVLVDMEGYSVEEAAASLGVPTGTIKSRCARARAKLVPLLSSLREPSGNQSGNRAGETDVQAVDTQGHGQTSRKGGGRS